VQLSAIQTTELAEFDGATPFSNFNYTITQAESVTRVVYSFDFPDVFGHLRCDINYQAQVYPVIGNEADPPSAEFLSTPVRVNDAYPTDEAVFARRTTGIPSTPEGVLIEYRKTHTFKGIGPWKTIHGICDINVGLKDTGKTRFVIFFTVTIAMTARWLIDSYKRGRVPAQIPDIVPTFDINEHDRWYCPNEFDCCSRVPLSEICETCEVEFISRLRQKNFHAEPCDLELQYQEYIDQQNQSMSDTQKLRAFGRDLLSVRDATFGFTVLDQFSDIDE
jgi:hypothetical protein